MDFLLDLIGGRRLPLFDPEVLALDRALPRSEVLALVALRKRGEATMSELASDIGAPLSTATGIGARLARRGLAERCRDPADRRIILVRLTPAGEQLAARMEAQVERLVRRVREALGEEQTRQLVSLLRKALEAVRAVPGDAPDERKTGVRPEPGARPVPIEE